VTGLIDCGDVGQVLLYNVFSVGEITFFFFPIKKMYDLSLFSKLYALEFRSSFTNIKRLDQQHYIVYDLYELINFI